MTRRSVLSIGALVATLTLALAAPVSAAPKVHYQTLINECTSAHLQVKFKLVKDLGVTGITKVEIRADAQKRVGTKWKSATNNFPPITRTLDGGKAKYTLTWSFTVNAPLSSKYRISTLLRAWSGADVVWSATYVSVTCGPTM